ncbi:hypothetical protein Aph01nite_76730 [Acrocarpospora phusangensis]|uniref:Uncharacterized protein n=1 Tax=Acrocarpospora phusangensis TaxID=1070424 RepID=A0A919QIE5_9ACTN|nr:hypothetical protein [Acrocarpospora phusangensis]GIH29363.1 hypothetical protein Aph01nite_76730 [Acrocarpospora phusangensis]
MPPGTIKTEPEGMVPLVTSREPKGPTRAGDPGSIGDQALKDALIIIVAAWAVLFFLGFSLRGFNI